MESFSSLLEAGVPSASKLSAITGNQDVIILGSDEDNLVRLAHSWKYLGGNVLCPNDKVVARFGLGSEATVFELYSDGLVADVKVASVAADILRNCSSKEESRRLTHHVKMLPKIFK